jgi:cytochrome c oxidase cbb3-type subunit 1
MWIAGVQQAGMWHAINSDGSLTYTFMEALVEMYPYWWMRGVGGVIYLLGIVVFIVNLLKTVQSGKPVADAVQAA